MIPGHGSTWLPYSPYPLPSTTFPHPRPHLQQTESHTEAAQSWDDDGNQPVHTTQPVYSTWDDDDDDGSQPVHAPAAEPTWDDDGSQPVKAEGWDSDGAQVLF